MPRSSHAMTQHDDTDWTHLNPWTMPKLGFSAGVAIREARTILRTREGAVLTFQSALCQDKPNCGQLGKITALSLSLKWLPSRITVLQADCLRDERQPRRHCVVTNQATERLRLSGQNWIAAPVYCETLPVHRNHQTDTNTCDVITPWLPHIWVTRISSSHTHTHTSRPHSHAAKCVRPHRNHETHAAGIQSARIIEKNTACGSCTKPTNPRPR